MPTTEALVPAPPTCAGETSATIGVMIAERIYAGLIVAGKLSGELYSYPSGDVIEEDEDTSLVELPEDALMSAACELILQVARGHESEIATIGVALPGLIRNGVVEEAPNLPQLKGSRIQDLVTRGLRDRGLKASVTIINDADAMAAGLACQHGRLDRMTRVWTIGTGIGYGIYPYTDGVWEGGHSVVSLDDKERYCGCGGRGHLEGIMGHRAMRLRFLDMEPEEVFEAANRRDNPDQRCVDFKRLWHKALAAATATSIHFRGPGKFFLSGYNIRFLDMAMLKDYLHQMVKMSPLQSYTLEVTSDDQSIRVLGAAVAAEHIATR